MNSRLGNFQKSFDDRHHINGSFDSHVASPSLCYNSHSVPTRIQHLQHVKMPGLLRLDSVGEVSSVKLPADGQTYYKVNSKPVLRNCASFDSDLASRTNRFLSKSNMASVKSLSSSPSKFRYGGQHVSAPVFTKEPSQVSQQADYHASKYYGLTNLGLSFDSCHRSSVLNNMHTLLAPGGMNGFNKLYGSSSQQKCTGADSTLRTAVDTYMCGVDKGRAGPAETFSSSPSILAAIAATYTASVEPPGFSVSAQSIQPTVSEKEENVPCIISASHLPVTEAKIHDSVNDTETVELVISAYQSDASNVSVKLVENCVVGRKLPATEASMSRECLPQLVFNNSQGKEDSSRNCDSDQKSTFDDTSHSPSKSATDISSVLPAPRKTAKKGRPSSKKQKKRHREKRKQEASPSLLKKCSSNSQVLNETEKLDPSEYDKIVLSQSEELDSSLTLFDTSCSQSHNSLQRESTPVKSQSKRCPIASLFFGPASDSEETDEIDGNSYNGSSEWSVNGDEKVFISPIKCFGFNAALNLDSIFKRKSIPSLKSVLRADDSESDSETQSTEDDHCQDLVLGSSKDDSFEDASVEFCVPLASSDIASFGFTTGLSVDSLFVKKPCLDGQATEEVTESTFDVVDGLSPSDGSRCLSSSLESCLEAISKINTKWNENYPSAGFRTCQTVSADEIKDPSIKVHFASGPNFLTVYIVGTEERGGTWHHGALDRERFQRRILDLEKVVSPILEASHRAKIQERYQF